MNELRRRAVDNRQWYQDPAWVSLIAALLLQLLVVSYQFGRIEARVDLVIEQDRHLLDIIVQQERRAGGQ